MYIWVSSNTAIIGKATLGAQILIQIGRKIEDILGFMAAARSANIGQKSTPKVLKSTETILHKL